MRLLGERFATTEHDGAAAYAAFLGVDSDDETRARLRQEAVAVVRTFLAAFTTAREADPT